MDAAMRCLREGALEAGHAPLLLLEDTLATIGGPAVFLQAVAELASSIAQGRAQARAVTIIALDRPPSAYMSLLQGLLAPGHLAILDCCTDPYGWLAQRSAPPTQGVSVLSGILQQPGGSLQRLNDLLCPQLGATLSSSGSSSTSGGPQPLAGSQPPAPTQCLIIDSLSKLLDCNGAHALCHWLHSLQRLPGVSCVLGGLHTDLHPAQALSPLRYLAAGVAALQPLSGLECSLGKGPGGAAPHGRLSVRLKRRAGRVRTEEQLFRVEEGVRVAYWDVPAALSTPEALAGSAVAAAAAEGGPGLASTSTPAGAAGAAAGVGGGLAGEAAGLAHQMEGGMKLSLTQEEEEARKRVQLPYEHQGKGSLYQTGDFRDYLPPEAGGHGSSGRLGHILYVRDSASEHDSDEDPDDDLDL